MKVLGVSGEEQKALWLILGAIYHLGAAGATKGRKARRRPRLRGNAGAFSPHGFGQIDSYLFNLLLRRFFGELLGFAVKHLEVRVKGVEKRREEKNLLLCSQILPNFKEPKL